MTIVDPMPANRILMAKRKVPDSNTNGLRASTRDVLSPPLWTLIVGEFLKEITDKGCQVVEYAL